MKYRLLIALLALAVVRSAFADKSEEHTDWDLSVKFGVSSGTIAKSQTETSNPDGSTNVSAGKSAPFGGFPFALADNIDLSRQLTLAVEVHFIADLRNAQLAEEGIALNLVYHLLGGSRRTTKDYGYSTVVERERYNLSLLARFGYAHFGISDQNGSEINTFDGSAFEPCLGLQYRQDISERSAIVLELYDTLTSLPASNTKVASKRYEFLFSYRFFL